MFEAALDDRDAVERAAIATERAHGPLLLVSGGDDRVWPADRMCTMIVDRMSKHGRGDGVKHLHYPNAGHMLFPYVRPSDVTFPAYPTDLGGTAADDLAAHTAAWPQVIEHLRGWCKRDAAGLWRKFVQPESVAAQDHSRNLLRPRAGHLASSHHPCQGERQRCASRSGRDPRHLLPTAKPGAHRVGTKQHFLRERPQSATKRVAQILGRVKERLTGDICVNVGLLEQGGHGPIKRGPAVHEDDGRLRCNRKVIQD